MSMSTEASHEERMLRYWLDGGVDDLPRKAGAWNESNNLVERDSSVGDMSISVACGAEGGNRHSGPGTATTLDPDQAGRVKLGRVLMRLGARSTMTGRPLLKMVLALRCVRPS